MQTNVFTTCNIWTDCTFFLSLKVPIVKFYLPRWNVEADISLYNTLALENTRLLALYCKFDERVELLGCTVKVFVKVNSSKLLLEFRQV